MATVGSLVKKVFQVCVIAFIFYIICSQIYSNWDQIKGYEWNVNWILICLSCILFFLCGVLASLNWLLILRFNGETINFIDSTRNWVTANFGKYVPGKIVQYASRVYLFERLGVRKTQTVVYMLLEMVYLLNSSVLVAGALILAQPWDNSLQLLQVKWILFGFLLVLNILVLQPSMLSKILQLVGKILRREITVTVRITFKHSVWLMTINILYWVLYGFSFAFFIHSFIPVNPNAYLFLVGANTIAYVIGYMSIIFPSGIGVREGLLTYLLGFLANIGLAGILSIFWRIFGILGEIAYYFFAVVASNRRS
jgi:hypothetical protein